MTRLLSKSKSKYIISLLTIMVLVMQIALPGGIFSTFADGEGPTGDKVNEHLEVSYSFKADGNELQPNDEGVYEIGASDNLSIRFDLAVPVEGDDPTPDNFVKKGDYAIFQISKDFIYNSTEPIDLVTTDNPPLKVGTVTLHTAEANDSYGVPEGMVYALVHFDEDILDDESTSGVNAWFSADFEFSGDQEGEEETAEEVDVLGKKFKVVIPAAPIDYSLEKSGEVDLASQSIEWTIVIDANQTIGDYTKPQPLDNLLFSDDLTNVGHYIDGSFSISTGDTTALNYANNILSYTFPENTTAPVTITFRTKIDDVKYFATTAQTITNTGYLKDGDDELAYDSEAKTFTPPTWIEKNGEVLGQYSEDGSYQNEDRKIKWTIEANHGEENLEDVTITDVLLDGLTFESAQWFKWNSTTSNWDYVNTFNSEPDNGVYDIGDITTKIKLEITAKVPDTADQTTGVTTYRNNATIKWTGGPATGVTAGANGGSGVGVGYNALTKAGTLNGNDSNNGDTMLNPKIKWTVGVDLKGQTIANPVVYDLLVYADAGFAVGDITAPAGLPDGVSWDNIKGSLKPKYNQKIKAGTFVKTKGDSALTGQVITLEDSNGKAVADLLVVTGFTNNQAYEFTFESVIVNPNLFATNNTSSSNKLYNTASLFNGENKLRDADASVTYAGHLLSKKLLKRDAFSSLDENEDDYSKLNSHRTDAVADGFDYLDKSVVYWLSVNADGLNLNNSYDLNGEILGNITLSDTLPSGWNFADFEDGSKFLIFEGTRVSGSADVNIVSNTKPLTSTAAADIIESSSFAPYNEGNGTAAKATIVFKKLDQPYVVLLKAKPSDQTLEELFSGNKTTTGIKNNVTLKAANDNWSGVDNNQDISITSDLVVKSKPVIDKYEIGQLLWHIDYKPNDTNQEGDYIIDKIPLGLDLPMDSSGSLLWENESGDKLFDIKILDLKSDGSYDEKDPEPILQMGELASYDNTTRELKFNIPVKTQAYRFYYVTDITGEPKETVENTATLYVDGEATDVSQGQEYVIADDSGGASLTRAGLVKIFKKDKEGQPLAGFTFTLYAADGVTPIRTGITDSNGELKLKIIPVGTYILKETATPENTNFEMSNLEYLVVVQKDQDGKPITTIDGKEGEGSNEITVYNYETGTVGNLVLAKIVTGLAADYSKEFTFTLELGDDPSDSSSYPYYRSDGLAGTIVSGGSLTLKNNQTVTIFGLPRDLSYKITETGDDIDNYHTSIVGSLESGGDYDTSIDNTQRTAEGFIIVDDTVRLDFTNDYQIPSTNFVAKKVWVDGSKIRPAAIKLELYRVVEGGNPELVEGSTPTLSKTNDDEWIYTWTGLPATNNSRLPYYYTVEEEQVDLFQAPAYDYEPISPDVNVIITNTYISPTTSVTVTKDWVDGPGASETTLQLKRNGQALTGAEYTIKLDGSETPAWTYTWSELDLTDSKGLPYVYTVVELGDLGNYLPDYSKPQEDADGNGIALTVTNNYISPKKDVTATKTWVDGPAVKPTIELQLYRQIGQAKKEAVGKAVELKNGKTTHTWPNLDVTDKYGVPYSYTVDEVKTPANYEKEISENGLAITNSYVSPTTDISANKIWAYTLNGNPNPDIQLQLYRDGIAFGEAITLKDGTTSYTWQGLDLTDKKGKAYLYTVDELAVPTDFEKEVSEDGLTITNTYKPRYTEEDAPDPNDPNSPEFIIIVDENGIPLASYRKEKQADGSFLYVDEDGIPLGGFAVPKTGEESPVNYKALALLLALAGLIFLIRRRKRHEQN